MQAYKNEGNRAFGAQWNNEERNVLSLQWYVNTASIEQTEEATVGQKYPAIYLFAFIGISTLTCTSAVLCTLLCIALPREELETQEKLKSTKESFDPFSLSGNNKI